MTKPIVKTKTPICQMAAPSGRLFGVYSKEERAILLRLGWTEVAE